jgi:hypothetical protein
MKFYNLLDKTSDRYKEINEALALLKKVIPRKTKLQEIIGLKNMSKKIKTLIKLSTNKSHGKTAPKRDT